jgi:hypothetical protein
VNFSCAMAGNVAKPSTDAATMADNSLRRMSFAPLSDRACSNGRAFDLSDNSV